MSFTVMATLWNFVSKWPFQTIFTLRSKHPVNTHLLFLGNMLMHYRSSSCCTGNSQILRNSTDPSNTFINPADLLDNYLLPLRRRRDSVLTKIGLRWEFTRGPLGLLKALWESRPSFIRGPCQKQSFTPVLLQNNEVTSSDSWSERISFCTVRS